MDNMNLDSQTFWIMWAVIATLHVMIKFLIPKKYEDTKRFSTIFVYIVLIIGTMILNYLGYIKIPILDKIEPLNKLLEFVLGK